MLLFQMYTRMWKRKEEISTAFYLFLFNFHFILSQSPNLFFPNTIFCILFFIIIFFQAFKKFFLQIVILANIFLNIISILIFYECNTLKYLIYLKNKNLITQNYIKYVELSKILRQILEENSDFYPGMPIQIILFVFKIIILSIYI